jgi:phytoene dehydrogenase-like protein
MSRSIIIIGAGIAGLSAGCYAQMNGYDSQIFELHDKPGGLCTSWKRQGYTFDGCIHWLVGSKPGTSFNHIWQELGASQGRQMVNHEEFMRVEEPDGKAFIIYTNVDRLETHLKELAPADARHIDQLCRTIGRFTRFDEATGGGSGFFGKVISALRTLSFIPSLIRYSRMPVQDFAARFSDPFLRESLAALFDMPDFPVIGMMMTLAWMHNRDAGYPIGGSLEFARAIERRYLGLGGEIHYRSRVDKVLVENDRASGVRLVDGTEHRADIVISAADGHATIFDMLEGKYVDDKVRSYYDEWPIFQPIILVSLGVDRDLSDEPHMVLCPLEEPISIAGEERNKMTIKHYCYDPTLAPKGKSVVELMFPSNYAHWQDLHDEPERYDAEKKDIAIKVIDQLEKRFPGFGAQVEVVDVATPMTFERYTANWQGSMEGWLPTTKNTGMAMGGSMDKTLPGLDGFYMVGQWVEPGGGLPPAATSGRNVISTICKQDGKAFKTQTP